MFSKKVYEHLGDRLSKEVYGYRMLYTETRDKFWLRQLSQTFPEGKKLIEKITQKDKRKVIFGAGGYGKEIAELFPVGWECFIDTYSFGGNYHNIPVLSFDEYLKLYSDADVYIGSEIFQEEMTQQLLNAGIKKKQIINAWEYCAPSLQRQYFDLPELSHNKNEVFVDCGCLDGQTSKNFIEWCDNQYKHIYAFEPDEINILQCKDVLAKDKAKIYPLGVWNQQAELHFESAVNGGSCLSEKGEQIVKVDSLDNVLGTDKDISFVKMDVEGAELKALQGAKKLIQKNKPKLAISVYHKPSDIYEIPQLLLEFNQNYIFYLRQYFFLNYETVLYAINKDK